MEALGEFRVVDFVVAVEGLAMMRNLSRSTDDVAARAAEVAMVVASAETDLLATRIGLTRYDVDGGYTRWAPRYDGPNPAIETETPIFRKLIEALPAGRALDAACGTGRHSALLTELGWDVVGVDATVGMLDVARAKVPSAEFREGRLEALPLDDASVDLVVCALALTHVEDLAPVYAEFARVLRAGGRVVTTDMHPITCMTFGMAGFPVDDERGRSRRRSTSCPTSCTTPASTSMPSCAPACRSRGVTSRRSRTRDSERSRPTTPCRTRRGRRTAGCRSCWSGRL